MRGQASGQLNSLLRCVNNTQWDAGFGTKLGFVVNKPSHHKPGDNKCMPLKEHDNFHLKHWKSILYHITNYNNLLKEGTGLYVASGKKKKEIHSQCHT